MHRIHTRLRCILYALFLFAGLGWGAYFYSIFTLPVATQVASVESLNKVVLKELISLSPTGLLQDSKGFIYIKVDDAYIHRACQVIQKKLGIQVTAPPYFKPPTDAGAHITVMYPEESKGLNITELNLSYTFTIKDIYYVGIPTGTYYMLRVECKELEKLREKYRLHKFALGLPFHITLAMNTCSTK